MKPPTLVVVSIALLVGTTLAGNPAVVTIGAVLSSPEFGDVFLKALRDMNANTEVMPPGLQFNGTYILMDDNPIRAARTICEDIIPHQVYLVIASHPIHSNLSPMAVSFTCGFYQIPVIGISARDSAFSDKNVHTSFMRTVAPYSDQAEVWADIIRYYKWSKVIFIHSSDQEGRAMLGRFQSRAENRELEIEKSIQYTSGQRNFTEELLQVSHLQARVILLYANKDDAEYLYDNAALLNLTTAGWAWLVTEQALYPSNTPQGVLGLRLRHSTNEAGHIQDSIQIIGQAFNDIYMNQNITEAPSECDQVSIGWEGGPIILQSLREQKVDEGATGTVVFNEMGDRIKPVYEFVNAKKKKVPTATLR